MVTAEVEATGVDEVEVTGERMFEGGIRERGMCYVMMGLDGMGWDGKEMGSYGRFNVLLFHGME